MKILTFFVTSFLTFFTVSSSSEQVTVKIYENEFQRWKVKLTNLFHSILNIFFVGFKVNHRKVYASKAFETQAEQNFYKNLNATISHNKNPNKTYTRGISSHSDLNFSQFKERKLGLNATITLGLRLRINDVISNKTVPISGKNF